MKAGLAALTIALSILMLVTLAGCADDDDDASDDAALPDDDLDDDLNDDADDDVNDDANDDADDDADDDTQPPDPWADMEPTGKMIDDILAISSHLSKSTDPNWKRDFEIEKLVDAGVLMLRTDFKWDYMEPADDQWNFAGYDVMVDQCLASGIQINALLDYGVDWAMPGGSHNEIPPEAWGDYAGGVAAHFADKIDLYEIWNEQNSVRFWKPEPNPAHYGELLKASYDAIHANDPNAAVLFGGLTPLDLYIFSDDSVWNFLVRVHDEHPDICQYFDGMAIHPYTFIQQSNPEWTLESNLIPYPDTLQAIDHARELLDRIGCGDKPIHLTEFGWPSLLIGPRRQAEFLARGLLLSASREIEYFFWYTFWDGSGGASLPTEDYFGLFTYPYTQDPPATEPKPSYEALLAIHDLLGSSRYAGDLGNALGWLNPQYALALADENGLWTIAAWHSKIDPDAALNVAVPLHPQAVGNWTLSDQNGEIQDQGAVDEGDIELTLSGDVQYIQFETSSHR
jgi:polysaccharide biosynthesis protein PslG